MAGCFRRELLLSPRRCCHLTTTVTTPQLSIHTRTHMHFRRIMRNVFVNVVDVGRDEHNERMNNIDRFPFDIR